MAGKSRCSLYFEISCKSVVDFIPVISVQQKSFLTQNPDYLAKVPEKLKGKAQKYAPAEAPAAESDSTQAAAGAAPATASLRRR